MAQTNQSLPISDSRLTGILIAASALFLYLNLFSLPRTPFLLGGDQVYFWMDAQRLLEHRHIYQNFLEFTPPGTDLYYLALFKLCGLRIWPTNATVLTLGIAFTALIYSIARRVMPRSAAALTASFFLVLIYARALNATHHWFGVFFILAALRVAITSLFPSRIAIAGALLGTSSFFSLYHGVAALLAFAATLLWQHVYEKTAPSPALHLLRNQTLLISTYLLTVLALNSPFIAAIGLRQLWYFQVTYIRQHVAPLHQGDPLGLPLAFTLRNLPALTPVLAIYIALPVATIIALYECLSKCTPTTRSIILIATAAVSLLAEIAFNPNWLRLYAVSAPAVIILIWLIHQTHASRYVIPILWLATLLIAARQTISHQASPRAIITLPAGKAATAPQAAAKLQTLMLHTHPRDLVLQAGWPGIYLPLHLRNPLSFDTVTLVDTPLPTDIALVIQQLQSQPVEQILWTATLDARCSQPACDDRLTPLRAFISKNYIPIHTFPDGDVLWQHVR